jgi:hypothetical protein
MSDLRKEATNLKALLSEAYENGARTAADEITSLRAQLASADEACQRLCGLHGYATGHGDTVAAMIDEISMQIPLTDDLREKS